MELTILGEQLLELKAFLDKHNQFFPANATEQSQRSPSNVHQKMLNFMRPEGMATDTQGHVHQSLLNKYKSDAYLMEHYSLQCLYSLINKCCESLSLWKLLCEYEFEATASHLSNEDKLLLKQFSFKKFVLEEKQLSASLISCLLARFSGDVSRINTLISHLRHHCHSLFSQEDEIASKANERVVVAVTLLSPTERQSALNDSLKLYSQVTEKINLQTVFEQYKTLHFYEGIIELTLCSAHREDPQNLALHFYKIGQPLTDCRGQEALSKRFNIIVLKWFL
jgi:nuclear pore complex protein Nup155